MNEDQDTSLPVELRSLDAPLGMALDGYAARLAAMEDLEDGVLDGDQEPPPVDPARVLADVELAYRLADALRRKPENLDLLDERHDDLVTDWLGELAFDLKEIGKLEDAIEFCGRVAESVLSEELLSDRAVLLALAGRKDEALKQVDYNLARWGQQLEVRDRAADALMEVGEFERAEKLTRAVIAGCTVEDEVLKYSATERLVELLEKRGAMDEARRTKHKLDELAAGKDVLEEMFSAFTGKTSAPPEEPTAVRKSQPKVKEKKK